MKTTPKHTPWKSVPFSEIFAVVLLLAVVCVIAWPGMMAPRLLDDLDQLSFIANFNSWKDSFGRDSFNLFRPIKNLIFCGAANLSLFQWHVLNLSIYLGAVLAVYFLMKRLLGKPGWALLAAALWATCPTQACTAIWMSCANISLSIILSCACIYFYDRSRENPVLSVGNVVLTGLLLFLAQISYETAVSVPALCVLVDGFRKRRLFSRPAMIHYAVFAAITLGFLILRKQFGAVSSVQSQNFGFSPDLEGWKLSVSAPWFLWKHFSMWLMPAGRIEFGSTYLWGISASPWELAAAWAWLLVVVGIVLILWKRLPWVSFGLLWFLITAFPSSNLVPIWAGPVEDYYLIFPGIGLSIALLGVSRAVWNWFARERAGGGNQYKWLAGTALAVVGLSRLICLPLFWYQASLWCNPLELYRNCELTRPGQFQMQALVAREFYLKGKLQQAEEWAMKSYKIAPWYPSSSMILGCVALDTSRLEEAEHHLQRVVSLTPKGSPVHDYSQLKLAMTLVAQSSQRHRVREILLPLLNNPRSPSHLDAINLQIDCYLKEKRPGDALRAANKAVGLHPENAQLASLLKSIESAQVSQTPATQ